jgi:hypothetical protein
MQALGAVILATICAAPAQVLIGLEKFEDYNQTAASADASPFGYHFNLPVSDSDLSGSNVSLNTPNDGTLNSTFADLFYLGSYSSANFDASDSRPALPNGEYTLTLDGNAATVALNGSFPTVVPVVSGAGAWSGGTLVINTNFDNTLSFNSADFASYYKSEASPLGGTVTFIIHDVSDNLVADVTSVDYYSDPRLDSYDLLAGTLRAGSTYYATLEFTQLVGLNLVNDLDATLYASFGTQTHFTIAAVPEPAGCAGATGIVALGLARLVRRRCLLQRRA